MVTTDVLSVTVLPWVQEVSPSASMCTKDVAENDLWTRKGVEDTLVNHAFHPSGNVMHVHARKKLGNCTLPLGSMREHAVPFPSPPHPPPPPPQLSRLPVSFLSSQDSSSASVTHFPSPRSSAGSLPLDVLNKRSL